MIDPIDVLAEFLTNNTRVVQTSIALGVGGRMAEEARAFYKLRDAFNVHGYCSKSEAIPHIESVFKKAAGTV
jgi:hypothetical protein